MRTRVSASGRITIPKRLRDRLGIRPGQALDLREENRRIVMTIVGDPATALYGILKLRRSTDRLIDNLRGRAARTC